MRLALGMRPRTRDDAEAGPPGGKLLISDRDASISFPRNERFASANPANEFHRLFTITARVNDNKGDVIGHWGPPVGSPTTCLRNRPYSRPVERIDERNVEGLEVTHVAGNNRQTANQRGGSDKCVLEMVIRLAMRELRPTSEDGRVRRKHSEALLHLVEPSLDFSGFCGILAPSDFYPRLYLTNRDGGNE